MSEQSKQPAKVKADGGAGKVSHPPGLWILFFAELWERFSFYGMRALLTLYMATPRRDTEAYAEYVRTKLRNKQTPNKPGLGYSKEHAQHIYHAYGALVYAFPVVGGKLADSLLGYRTAIIIGGVTMALGHFIMTIENTTFFFGALALIAIGNGFFKPNISSLVGKLYKEGDPRRDAGFTIFYMGINLGALIAPGICGFLGEGGGWHNWHYGFGLAGVGMCVGLGWFIRGRKLLEGHGEPPDAERLATPVVAGLNPLILVLLGAVAMIPLAGLGLWKNEYIGYVLYTVGLIVLGYLFYVAFTEERAARHKLFLVMVLIIFHTSFWAVFEQAGSSFTFLTDTFLDRKIFGIGLKTSYFQMVNPSMIVLLAPLFAKTWSYLTRVDKNPSIPTKFALGNIGAALGFVVIVLGAHSVLDNVKEGASVLPKMPLFFMILTYLMHTIGELCLSPVGLSAITKLSPPRAVGTVMGSWFLTISMAHKMAGFIAGLTTPHGFNKWQPVRKLARYSAVYKVVAAVVGGMGILLGLLSGLLKKLAHGVE